MSGLIENDDTPLEGLHQIQAYFEQGIKEQAGCGIGVELEFFLVHRPSGHRLTYEGNASVPVGLRQVQEHLVRCLGLEPRYDGEVMVELREAHYTLFFEPGGQIECASRVFPSNAVMWEMLIKSLEALEACLGHLEVGLLLTGMWGEQGSAPPPQDHDHFAFPRGRYELLRGQYAYNNRFYEGKIMMNETAALQMAVDYTSEANMAKLYRVSAALQPLFVARSAYSPRLVAGEMVASYRMQNWMVISGNRLPKDTFSPHFGFHSYIDYLLDHQMMYVRRGEVCYRAYHLTFREYLARKDPALPAPMMQDVHLHLSAVFPIVRLRHYLEVRGMDMPASLHDAQEIVTCLHRLLYDAALLEVLDREVLALGLTREACLHQVERAARMGKQFLLADEPLFSRIGAVLKEAQICLVDWERK